MQEMFVNLNSILNYTLLWAFSVLVFQFGGAVLLLVEGRERDADKTRWKSQETYDYFPP